MRFIDGTCYASAADLNALLAFASRDETRPHLAAVWIDTAGHAFATDGHTLAVAGDYTKKGGDLICLSRADAAACARVAGKGEVMIGYGVAGFETGYEEGNFKAGPPPIATVIAAAVRGSGQPTSAFVWDMSADYMVRLKLIAKASGKVATTVRAPEHYMEPVVFVNGNWLVLVMPMRCDAGTAARPIHEARNAKLNGGAS